MLLLISTATHQWAILAIVFGRRLRYGRARAGLEHHGVDVLNKFMLLCIKHVIVTLVKLVPEVGVSGVVPSQDKDKVILVKLGFFVGVRYHVLYHSFDIRLNIIHIFGCSFALHDGVFDDGEIDILLPI